jgi:hypothetical protein
MGAYILLLILFSGILVLKLCLTYVMLKRNPNDWFAKFYGATCIATVFFIYFTASKICELL